MDRNHLAKSKYSFLVKFDLNFFTLILKTNDESSVVLYYFVMDQNERYCFLFKK